MIYIYIFIVIVNLIIIIIIFCGGGRVRYGVEDLVVQATGGEITLLH